VFGRGGGRLGGIGVQNVEFGVALSCSCFGGGGLMD
jgi:hypothetical protein